jgi:molybdate transport system substrate-binding protein
LLSAVQCAASGDQLLVFAAASLRDALTPLGEEFGSKHNLQVRFNLGGSVTLSQQLQRQAPGDLFISAGRDPMDRLEAEGLLAPGSRRALLTNQLALVVPTDSKVGTASLEEMLAGSPRVALADPRLAPAGQYAQEALQTMGLWETLKPRLVFAPDVRTALVYVTTGNASIGIVYLTDASITDRVRVAKVVPTELHSPIVYPMAVLERSRHKGAAYKFADFLLEEASLARFQQHGFGVSSPQSN